MLKLLKLSLILILCCYLNGLHAQNESKYYLVHTKNGSKIKGILLEKNDDTITILADSVGELTIKNDDIKLMRAIVQKRPWTTQALKTKNFWLPTAFAPRAGESYYQNIAGLFNQFNIGVANNLSIGFGAVPLFFSFSQPWPIWATAKYTLPTKSEQLHYAIGGVAGQMMTSDIDPAILVGYGLMTYGNKKNNFTVGLAYGKYDGRVKKYPITALCGNFHVVGPLFLTTENYFFFNVSKLLDESKTKNKNQPTTANRHLTSDN